MIIKFIVGTLRDFRISLDPAIRAQFLQDFAGVQQFYIRGNYSDPSSPTAQSSFALRPTGAPLPQPPRKTNNGEQYGSNIFLSLLSSIIATLI
jgi:hypothetical protein